MNSIQHARNRQEQPVLRDCSPECHALADKDGTGLVLAGLRNSVVRVAANIFTWKIQAGRTQSKKWDLTIVASVDNIPPRVLSKIPAQILPPAAARRRTDSLTSTT